ncbi:MAG: ketopantoate reductase family protein [Candidatus Heimdallarchaeaceae archaeon]
MAEGSKSNKVKVLVVGPGAIGTAVATPLALADVDLKVLGRDRHKEHFAKNKMVYITKKSKLQAKIDAVTLEDLKESEWRPDAIMITLKANSTLPLVKEFEKVFDHDTPIVSLQNGLIAQDIVEQSAFSNVIACVVGFNVKVNKLGEAEQTSEGDLVIGRVGKENNVSSTDVPEFISEVLNNVAPTKVSENIVSDVWMKLMINSTINPICAIGNIPLGELANLKSGLFLGLWTWKEMCDVVDAIGLKLNPFQGVLFPEVLYVYDIISYGIAKNVLKRIVSPHKDAIVSMLQDIRAGRTTEIDHLNGKVYEIGQKYGVPMPINEVLIKTIKELEKGEKKPGKGLLNKLYREIILEVR